MEDRLAHPSSRRDSNLMRSVNTNLRQRSETLSGWELLIDRTHERKTLLEES